MVWDGYLMFGRLDPKGSVCWSPRLCDYRRLGLGKLTQNLPVAPTCYCFRG